MIAEWSTTVHSFDLAPEVPVEPPNVVFHVGDTRSTLPAALAELAGAGVNVDFVLVDADHSRRGVAADVRAILDSPAISRAIILLHDAANEDVRAGIRDADLDRPKVMLADLSFTTPSERLGPFRERWGGFGMIVVDESGEFWEHPRHGVLANASWRTSAQQPLTWRLASPARWLKRRIAYEVVRPLLRGYRGSRGRPLSGG